jgi:hypothetical protein
MGGGSGSVVGHARLLPCLWCEPKGVLRICGDSGDGHDTHDGHLRAYFNRGAPLLRRPLPLNLTRRTRRGEQGAPYLCGFPTYDWRRVLSHCQITRRRYPTTDHPPRRVYREHRRVLVTDLTTTNPLLMLDTPAIVGFVGLYERV